MLISVRMLFIHLSESSRNTVSVVMLLCYTMLYYVILCTYVICLFLFALYVFTDLLYCVILYYTECNTVLY